MATRWYTADFHIGMPEILQFAHRPFHSIYEMEDALRGTCLESAAPDDIIIHVGDLYTFGTDGRKQKPADFIRSIPATFINLRGNHDVNNKVKSIGESMRTSLGKRFPSVSISHYPTYDSRCFSQYMPGDIHLCGHVHGAWRHCLDLEHKCLNINVGVDVWKYKIISEEQLIRYLNYILSFRPDMLYRCSHVGRTLKFYGQPFGLMKKEGN